LPLIICHLSFEEERAVSLQWQMTNDQWQMVNVSSLNMMQRRTLMIENPLGLHARAGARLVKLANGFQSDILLARSDSPERTVDAKSILSVLLLAATQGTMIDIVTEGKDEAEAMEALCRLVKEKLGDDGTEYRVTSD